jgi:hypothetical protein
VYPAIRSGKTHCAVYLFSLLVRDLRRLILPDLRRSTCAPLLCALLLLLCREVLLLNLLLLLLLRLGLARCAADSSASTTDLLTGRTAIWKATALEVRGPGCHCGL